MQVDLPPAGRGRVCVFVRERVCGLFLPQCRTLDFFPNMDTYFTSSSICCRNSLVNATAIVEFYKRGTLVL